MTKLIGKCKKCKLSARAMIRTFFVCPKHFNKYKLDNVRRIKLGIDIPKKLITIEEENEDKKRT